MRGSRVDVADDDCASCAVTLEVLIAMLVANKVTPSHRSGLMLLRTLIRW